MKLLKLHIQNFQSHRNTYITFTDGLNTIIGPTDTGKSAILRALRKLIRDDPGGKAFISKWSNDMTITLTFERNSVEYIVKRRVTPSKNLYYLDNEKYGGFGKTIPQEISDALNMSLVELENGDELDLYFADQHDPPFMISKGQAGIRSKLLGRIAGLHILDRAITRVNSDIRAENSALKYKDEERSNLQYSLEDLPDLWHELTLVDTLIESIRKVKVDQVKYENILKVHEKLLQIQDVAKQAADRLTKIPDIRAPFKCIITRIENQQHMIDLHQKLVECEGTIVKLTNLTPSEIKVDFEGIKDRIVRLNRLKEVFNKLTTIAADANSIDVSLIVKSLEECTKEHSDILTELGICPTCKKPIGDHLHD